MGHSGHGPAGGGHSSHHLFTFPPTPPKDATPDTVSGPGSNTNNNNSSSHSTANNSGSNSHNHQHNSHHHTSNSDSFSLSQSDGLESKGGYPPHMLSSWGSSLSNCSNVNKPREGTNGSSSSFVQSSNPYHHPSSHFVPPSSGASSVDFGVSGSAYNFHGHSSPAHSASSFHNSLSKSVQSSNNKPRSKARSSAGKRDITTIPVHHSLAGRFIPRTNYHPLPTNCLEVILHC